METNSNVYYGNLALIDQEELAHHGIKGQKWGIRRYQNEDGSLTAEGMARYGVSENKNRRYSTAEMMRMESNVKKQQRLEQRTKNGEILRKNGMNTKGAIARGAMYAAGILAANAIAVYALPNGMNAVRIAKGIDIATKLGLAAVVAKSASDIYDMERYDERKKQRNKK